MYILFNIPFFFILICSMLNKLSNGAKITKNGVLQREIWRPEISPTARVFRKNPSLRLVMNQTRGLPHSCLVAREAHPELCLASVFVCCDCNSSGYFNKIFINFSGNKK
jgi:hypothetical protein